MAPIKIFHALAVSALLQVVALADPVNLVANGDFEAGNTGFTSGYTNVTVPPTNDAEGIYIVGKDPTALNFRWMSFGDHTTGAGNMMIVNGAPVPNTTVWQSGPIAINSNTNYFFETWAANLCCNPQYGVPTNPAILEFSWEGNVTGIRSLGTVTTNLTPGLWQFLSNSVNSLGDTEVTLRLVNQNTERSGNDFALDDVHLGTESSVPEPSTMLLGGAGLMAGAAFRFVRRRRS